MRGWAVCDRGLGCWPRGHVKMEGGVMQPGKPTAASAKVNLKYPRIKEMSIPTLALQRTVVLSVTQLECPPLCRDSHPPTVL